MTADPRAALSDLVSALERHLEVAAARRGDNDPNVAEAYDRVIETFEVYDEALMETYGEVTPLEVYDDEDGDDFDDDDEDDDFDDDETESDDDDEDTYTGLDDEEFDVEDQRR